MIPEQKETIIPQVSEIKATEWRPKISDNVPVITVPNKTPRNCSWLKNDAQYAAAPQIQPYSRAVEKNAIWKWISLLQWIFK